MQVWWRLVQECRDTSFGAYVWAGGVEARARGAAIIQQTITGAEALFIGLYCGGAVSLQGCKVVSTFVVAPL